jgi:hypothetical protein
VLVASRSGAVLFERFFPALPAPAVLAWRAALHAAAAAALPRAREEEEHVSLHECAPAHEHEPPARAAALGATTLTRHAPSLAGATPSCGCPPARSSSSRPAAAAAWTSSHVRACLPFAACLARSAPPKPSLARSRARSPPVAALCRAVLLALRAATAKTAFTAAAILQALPRVGVLVEEIVSEARPFCASARPRHAHRRRATRVRTATWLRSPAQRSAAQRSACGAASVQPGLVPDPCPLRCAAWQGVVEATDKDTLAAGVRMKVPAAAT